MLKVSAESKNLGVVYSPPEGDSANQRILIFVEAC